jgi:hypothetical protein
LVVVGPVSMSGDLREPSESILSVSAMSTGRQAAGPTSETETFTSAATLPFVMVIVTGNCVVILAETLGVRLSDLEIPTSLGAPGDGEGEGDPGLGEGLGEGNDDGLGLGLGDADPLGPAVPDGLGLGDGEGVGVGEGDGDGEGEGLGVGVGVGVGVGDGVGSGEGVGESVGGGGQGSLIEIEPVVITGGSWAAPLKSRWAAASSVRGLLPVMAPASDDTTIRSRKPSPLSGTVLLLVSRFAAAQLPLLSVSGVGSLKSETLLAARAPRRPIACDWTVRLASV